MKISLFVLGCFVLVSAFRAEAKLTTTKPQTLALDAKIEFKGVDRETGQLLTDEFESQLGKFGRCTRHDKNETLRMTAQFQLTKKGRFDNFKVTENLPVTPKFVSCFSKKIKEIKLTAPPRKLMGQLLLHVDYVEKAGIGIQKSAEQPHIDQ
jgi:hypothetical protein